MFFDILFIRHGQSCANIWSKISKQKQISYKDPELTQSGIQSSIQIGKILQDTILTMWKNESFTVGSSQMIRTQQTAYFMIAKDTSIPIHIIPHISEKGITLDNWSLPKQKQYEILQQKTPSIIPLLEAGMDARENQTIFEKSNWNLFISWASKHTEFFAQGSDGIYRAVLFTHSKFLQSAFKLSSENKIKNNNGIRVIINTDNPSSVPEYTKITLGTIIPQSCPDNCFISSCPDSITKINTRLKINTRKNNFYSDLELNQKPIRFRGNVPKNITNQYKASKGGKYTRRLRRRSI